MELRPENVVTAGAYHYVLQDIIGSGEFGCVWSALALRADCARSFPPPTPALASCACLTPQRRAGAQRVAVKIVKRHPAYSSLASMEIHLLSLLQRDGARRDDGRAHIVTLLDHFTHDGCTCLVLEQLDSTVLDVLQRRAYVGLDVAWVRAVLAPLCSALHCLNTLGLVHGDVKPENVMVTFPHGHTHHDDDGDAAAAAAAAAGAACGAGGPVRPLPPPSSCTVKLIDLGSGGYEPRGVDGHGRARSTNWYVQSRFYRAPEVVLGLPYDGGMDAWSLGCLAAELLLGVPLFSGSDAHDVLARAVQLLGAPPEWMLHAGAETRRYMVPVQVHPGAPRGPALPPAPPTPPGRVSVPVLCAPKRGCGQTAFRLMTREEWAAGGGGGPAPALTWGKTVYASSCLEELVMGYDASSGLVLPLAHPATAADVIRRARAALDGVARGDVAGDAPLGSVVRHLPVPLPLAGDHVALADRLSLLDLLSRLLVWDPTLRLTPGEALLHPFLWGGDTPRPDAVRIRAEVQRIRAARGRAWGALARQPVFNPSPLVLGSVSGGAGRPWAAGPHVHPPRTPPARTPASLRTEVHAAHKLAQSQVAGGGAGSGSSPGWDVPNRNRSRTVDGGGGRGGMTHLPLHHPLRAPSTPTSPLALHTAGSDARRGTDDASRGSGSAQTGAPPPLVLEEGSGLALHPSPEGRSHTRDRASKSFTFGRGGGGGGGASPLPPSLLGLGQDGSSEWQPGGAGAPSGLHRGGSTGEPGDARSSVGDAVAGTGAPSGKWVRAPHPGHGLASGERHARGASCSGGGGGGGGSTHAGARSPATSWSPQLPGTPEHKGQEAAGDRAPSSHES